MLRNILKLAAIAALGAGSTATAQTVIQPTDVQSKDTFIYSFLSGANFNNAPGFNTVLVSGRSPAGHDLRSLVQFDLGLTTMGPGDIATLNLFVTNSDEVQFPVGDPSVAFPVQAAVYAVTADWNASTVTWGNQPTSAGSALDTETIDGVGRYVTFDVTTVVQSWTSGATTNFGFSIQQPGVVVNAAGESVQAVYHSAASANRPFLYVGPVPEPTGIAVLASAGGLLILRRRA